MPKLSLTVTDAEYAQLLTLKEQLQGAWPQVVAHLLSSATGQPLPPAPAPSAELTLDTLHLTPEDRQAVEKLLQSSGHSLLHLVRLGLLLQTRPAPVHDTVLDQIAASFDLLVAYNESCTNPMAKVYIDMAILQTQSRMDGRFVQDWYIQNLDRVKAHHKQHNLVEPQNRMRLLHLGRPFRGVERGPEGVREKD
ncbi:MAG: hypothetical protein IGQ88_13040 [Gloeomargaritaceae cyanobacterium C42_A2020_066]|nr:hypothetical protein [Gloeomargaritaceae cyanobacterium C42_A2020_066]